MSDTLQRNGPTTTESALALLSQAVKEKEKKIRRAGELSATAYQPTGSIAASNRMIRYTKSERW